MNAIGSNQNRGTEQNVAGANHGIQITNNHYYAPSSDESSSVPEPKTSKRLGIHIGTTFAECDRAKLEAIVILLREISGDDSIQLIDLQEGSIKLIVEGSEEGLKHIEELFASGELKELEGLKVEEINTLTEEEEKQTNEKLRLIEAIRTQQITDLRGVNLRGVNLRGVNLRGVNLSTADLRGVNLIEAKLREAKLRGADLFGADLREAKLRRADLRGVDLRQANLGGANLGGANLKRTKLRGADLRGTDLRRAYFRETDLRGADLRGTDLRKADLGGAIVELAYFGYNQGIDETLKADLIQRGAIFEDSPGDRSSVSSPAPIRR